MRNLKTVALVMAKDHDRGLHQRRVDVDGHESIFVDQDTNTVGAEIRHVHWYVDQLRWELKHWTVSPPHVQMWLW